VANISLKDLCQQASCEGLSAKVYSESRMREIRTSGSTRGKADGINHLLSYSTANPVAQIVGAKLQLNKHETIVKIYSEAGI
jgi:hypothetical protein